jgi:hypothetical protein
MSVADIGAEDLPSVSVIKVGGIIDRRHSFGLNDLHQIGERSNRNEPVPTQSTVAPPTALCPKLNTCSPFPSPPPRRCSPLPNRVNRGKPPTAHPPATSPSPAATSNMNVRSPLPALVVSTNG